MTTTISSTIATPCPSWCTDQHAQALDDGLTADEAGVHWGPGYGGKGDGGRYDVQLLAYPCQGWFIPALRVEVVKLGSDALAHVEFELSPGDARTLAARLLRLADLADLEH